MQSFGRFPRVKILLLAALFLVGGLVKADEEKKRPHPLAPLSEAEINTAAKLVKKKHGNRERLLFPMLALKEPSKNELAKNKTIPRRAVAVILDQGTGTISEAVVDLDKEQVALKARPGLKSMVTVTQMEAAIDMVRKSKEWRDAIKGRKVEPDNVYLSVWAPGQAFSPKPGNAKYRVIGYYEDKKNKEINVYGRPIEGVVALFDEVTGEVEVEDAGNVGYPPDSEDFFSKKPMPKPKVSNGPDFTVPGARHDVKWQNWRFRYAMHPREGLVLYDVRYNDQGTLRKVLSRASLSEMVVPYGDPGAAWNWRSAFDQGEYGIGWYANPLQLGLDVPENARLYDAVFANDFGKAETREGVVAIYERDGGLLWKHHDERVFARKGMKAEARRARDLVITSTSTVGNYDYAFYWIFRQDGSIQVRVGLTGILLAKGVGSNKCQICEQIDRIPNDVQHTRTVVPGGDQRFGTLVGRRVVAANHQHILNFRLDFDVDGEKNCFSEMNVRPYVGPNNPKTNAFLQTETIFAKERDARRSISLPQNRTWKIFNPKSRNALGHHRSYVLIPGENGVPYLGRDSLLRKKAAFMNHHVWVTQRKPDEMHAAGDYPRQNPKNDGLQFWSGDDSIASKDLVLWHTVVVTHVPRPEEWPVMPTAEVGFRLAPWGFFSRNPVLNVP